MSLFRNSCTVLAIAAISAFASAHDEWEPDDVPEDTSTVLLHAQPAQVHDLQSSGGIADVDWFHLVSEANRSYEVRITNGTSGALTGQAASLRRYGASSVLLQNSTFLGPQSRALRWVEPAVVESTHVRVTNVHTTSSANSKYTIKLYETTLYCPRYNNTGTQVSVLIVQQTAPDLSGCSFTARFNTEGGFENGETTRAFLRNSTSVIATPSIPGVNGTSGSAFIAHTCGIGGIKAKLVALEPATGFSFDTICSMREY